MENKIEAQRRHKPQRKSWWARRQMRLAMILYKSAAQSRSKGVVPASHGGDPVPCAHHREGPTRETTKLAKKISCESGRLPRADASNRTRSIGHHRILASTNSQGLIKPNSARMTHWARSSVTMENKIEASTQAKLQGNRKGPATSGNDFTQEPRNRVAARDQSLASHEDPAPCAHQRRAHS
jgi:hypothetical protein